VYKSPFISLRCIDWLHSWYVLCNSI